MVLNCLFCRAVSHDYSCYPSVRLAYFLCFSNRLSTRIWLTVAVFLKVRACGEILSRERQYQQQKHRQRSEQRRSLIGSGDRSDRIRTYNFPQNRLTDHRINLTLYKLDAIRAGELGELIAALRAHDRKERLEQAPQG